MCFNEGELSFGDEDVLELPGVFQVKIMSLAFEEEVLQRSPVSIITVHWADIFVLNLETLFVIQFVAFHVTGFRVLESPGHSGDDC